MGFRSINLTLYFCIALASAVGMAEDQVHTTRWERRRADADWSTKFSYGRDSANSFPGSASVEDQFPGSIAQQKGGFCHVYAAVNLLEAFCYRETGHHVDISEEYYVYRHLRNEYSSYKSMSVTRKAEPGFLTDQDGGHEIETIKRFWNGSMCTKDEFPFYEGEFEGKLRDYLSEKRFAAQTAADEAKRESMLHSEAREKAKKAYQDAVIAENGKLVAEEAYKKHYDYVWINKESRATKVKQVTLQNFLKNPDTTPKNDSIRDIAQKAHDDALESLGSSAYHDSIGRSSANAGTDFVSYMDSLARDKGKATISDSNASRSVDPHLRECLEHRATVKHENWEEKRAVQLLAAGLPFVCVGNFSFQEGDAGGSHATTVIGYRYDRYTNKVSFQTRDSNRTRPMWWKDFHCKKIHILYRPGFDFSE